MTMTTDDARKIERPPIVVGHQYDFYSTVQQENEQPEQQLRTYTGKLVTVLRQTNEDECRAEDAAIARGEWKEEERETEAMFKVRAANGFEFEAYEGELNGWFKDTGQFFWPDATWGPEHSTFALANERISG